MYVWSHYLMILSRDESDHLVVLMDHSNYALYLLYRHIVCIFCIVALSV